MGQFILLLFLGFATMFIAHHKGRNPIGWFFVGFCLPILGFVMVLVCTNHAELNKRFSVMEKTLSDLRKQVKQQKQIIDRLEGIHPSQKEIEGETMVSPTSFNAIATTSCDSTNMSCPKCGTYHSGEYVYCTKCNALIKQAVRFEGK